MEKLSVRPNSVQHCLPPLATVFSFPNQGFDKFSAKVDEIIASGEYGISVVFNNIREALADGEGERDPVEMETLAGVIGTGITLLEAIVFMAEQRDIKPLKQEKLRMLLKEYKNLFEDIKMFSQNISAEDLAGAQETIYLLSNPANAAHLRKSIADIEAGKGIEVRLEDL